MCLNFNWRHPRPRLSVSLTVGCACESVQACASLVSGQFHLIESGRTGKRTCNLYFAIGMLGVRMSGDKRRLLVYIGLSTIKKTKKNKQQKTAQIFWNWNKVQSIYQTNKNQKKKKNNENKLKNYAKIF